jgi:hypothetical protein
MHSTAGSVQEYLEGLPDDRRELVGRLREEFLRVMPEGIEEHMRWGMISYEIPLEASGPTYNAQPLVYAALASQKHHVSLYLMGAYLDPQLLELLRTSHEHARKRLDMGKSCIRIKRLEDVELESVRKVLGAYSVGSYLAAYRLITTKA